MDLSQHISGNSQSTVRRQAIDFLSSEPERPNLSENIIEIQAV